MYKVRDRDVLMSFEDKRFEYKRREVLKISDELVMKAELKTDWRSPS